MKRDYLKQLGFTTSVALLTANKSSMSMAAKCTCNMSSNGICNSSVKECKQRITPSPTTQLPAEVLEEIEALIRLLSDKRFPGDAQNFEYLEYEAGVKAGVTEYATKLHQVEQDNKRLIKTLLEIEQGKLKEAQQEIESLKRWKAEASEILNPILDYGQSKEADIRLGGSISDIIIERCKQATTARTLLQKFISRHEAGLLPDRFIYDEIKHFLDGK